MTEIDFYILRPQSRSDRFGLACRLIEKAYGQGRRVLTYTASSEDSQRLDRLLWEFRDQSFIPHGLLRQTDARLNPVLIGHQDDPAGECDVLVNLTARQPPFYQGFQRLAELIDQDPRIISAGRQRYRQYQQSGHPVRHHDIN
ncbi:MAG: DNA polymerase III subunit chi [Gammaproteobacteria bacterium SHHR-1]|uniref:DNA polymerase III subunit chi n=1 Tax=Magnetovirga frankeli TaxID=947516 RepID=UPI00129300D6|nr:DNA polymerase III subunit chi [gamma proteobacterium SS-5]